MFRALWAIIALVALGGCATTRPVECPYWRYELVATRDSVGRVVGYHYEVHCTVTKPDWPYG